MLRRMRKSRRAAYAPILTVGYVFFCILYYIILVAFSQDTIAAEEIGSISNFQGIEINQTEDSSSVSYSDRTWISKFFITVFGMPWWVTVLTVSFQVVFLSVIILAWVRGV